MASIAKLLQTGKTIFTTPELSEIWNTLRTSAKTITTRKVKAGKLFRITRGVFSLKPDYNPFELASKLVPGSYISLFTVLKEKGVIFQEFDTIFSIAPRAKTIKINDLTYEYHAIKNLMFFEKGINFEQNYSIATLERAILDCFFLFDTDFTDFKITSFNKDLFLDLSQYYNKKTAKKAQKFIKHFKL